MYLLVVQLSAYHVLSEVLKCRRKHFDLLYDDVCMLGFFMQHNI